MIKSLTICRTWFLKNPKLKWLSFLPALLWAGLIFWLSSQSFLPKLETPWTEFLWKKTAHFLIYGGLYFWLWWGKNFSQPKIIKSAKTNLVFLMIILIYASSDELHQSFVAFRHPSGIDVGIDMLGAISCSFWFWQQAHWPKWLFKISQSILPSQST